MRFRVTIPFFRLLVLIALAAAFVDCSRVHPQPQAHKPGEFLHRSGDEIVACGQLIHTGAPVVLWMDPGGYDAYRVERRFVPWDDALWEQSHKQVPALQTPNRYGPRMDSLTDDEFERVRGGGWDLPLLQRTVDQFVLHYDVCGVSKLCFAALQDQRGLSVHFMLDLDGTIYQTLDLKERAWHATVSNSRSIGIEIANLGAYPVGGPNLLGAWYAKDPDGRTRITLPKWIGDGGIRTPDFVGRPIRNDPVIGEIQGLKMRQYDLTPQQYDSLIKLTATLCKVFPLIRCDYPRDAAGVLINHKLPDDQLAAYHGLIGHYHIQLDKQDPGPALQWDRIVDGARELMK